MLRSCRNALGLAAVAVFAVVGAGFGAASAAIIEPASAPVVVAVSKSGASAAVTVVAGGFTPGALVYVEQCDGVAASVSQWSPTAHCDLGTSPAPAIADSRGFATLASTDKNRAFHPVDGESPQSLFNCLAPGEPAPKNGLPSFTNCTLRVSTNNAATTADQIFLAIAFTQSEAGGAAVTTAKPATTSTTNATATTKEKPGSVVVPGSKAASSSGPKAKAAPKTAAIAVVAAPHHDRVGMWSLSDGRLVTGYVLILAGSLIALLAVSVRRRDSGRRRAVTSAQISGER